MVHDLLNWSIFTRSAEKHILTFQLPVDEDPLVCFNPESRSNRETLNR
jgi:hypothetical protein